MNAAILAWIGATVSVLGVVATAVVGYFVIARATKRNEILGTQPFTALQVERIAAIVQHAERSRLLYLQLLPKFPSATDKDAAREGWQEAKELVEQELQFLKLLFDAHQLVEAWNKLANAEDSAVLGNVDIGQDNLRRLRANYDEHYASFVCALKDYIRDLGAGAA